METNLPQKDIREMEIGGEVYDVVTPQGSAVVNAIMYTWRKLGKPKSPFSEAGKKLMEVIVATWEDTMPDDAAEWYEVRKEYKNAELSAKEQVKKNTGRSLASYPYYIFLILKKIYPGIKLSERETAMKMVKHFPMFKFTDKV